MFLYLTNLMKQGYQEESNRQRHLVASPKDRPDKKNTALWGAGLCHHADCYYSTATQRGYVLYIMYLLFHFLHCSSFPVIICYSIWMNINEVTLNKALFPFGDLFHRVVILLTAAGKVYTKGCTKTKLPVFKPTMWLRQTERMIFIFTAFITQTGIFYLSFYHLVKLWQPLEKLSNWYFNYSHELMLHMSLHMRAGQTVCLISYSYDFIF